MTVDKGPSGMFLLKLSSLILKGLSVKVREMGREGKAQRFLGARLAAWDLEPRGKKRGDFGCT